MSHQLHLTSYFQQWQNIQQKFREFEYICFQHDSRWHGQQNANRNLFQSKYNLFWCNIYRTKWGLTCCRSSTLGCTQVICTFWSTSSMLPLIRPTDRAFITKSSTCRRQTYRASDTTTVSSFSYWLNLKQFAEKYAKTGWRSAQYRH